MNKTDLDEFHRVANDNTPTFLLPENLPDNWLHKLLEETLAMDSNQTQPGQNMDGITFATLQLRIAKLARSHSSQAALPKLDYDTHRYASLVRIDATQREGANAGQDNQLTPPAHTGQDQCRIHKGLATQGPAPKCRQPLQHLDQGNPSYH